MATKHRDIETQEEISGAFVRLVKVYDGVKMGNPDDDEGDTLSFSKDFLGRATPQQLADVGIEAFEYTTQSSTDPIDYPLEPFQFFAMLEILGKTGAVNTAIDAITDATERAVARSKFQHMKVFRRDNSLFTTLAPAVGLTDAQIDIAWMQAKEIA